MGGAHEKFIIFVEPPPTLGEGADFEFGTLLVNYNSNRGIKALDIAKGFMAAAERLIDAEAVGNECHEAAFPILFCYRHALEIMLKDIWPNSKKNHDIGSLWSEIKPTLSENLLNRLVKDNEFGFLICEQVIKEFCVIDKNSTYFRYYDSGKTAVAAELWVDYRQLKHVMNLAFNELWAIRLESLESRRETSKERK